MIYKYYIKRNKSIEYQNESLNRHYEPHEHGRFSIQYLDKDILTFRDRVKRRIKK